MVEPNILFGEEYPYLTGSSAPLREHFAKLAEELEARYEPKGSLIVDIGCNDGTLLESYKEQSSWRIGVDPSGTSDIAKAKGFHVYKNFFDRHVAEDIRKRYGCANIITATNVFPHVDDAHGFIDAISHLLDDEGVFVVEASYLPKVIDDVLFDVIYHEHLSYLSLIPTIKFLNSHGLEIFHAEPIAITGSGPSIRMWIQHIGTKREKSMRYHFMVEEERRWGVRIKRTYQDYAKNVERLRDCILAIVEVLLESKLRLGAYGASAKGNTMLNYLGLTCQQIKCVADNNPRKVGKLTPGSHIPVVSDEEFVRSMPDYALLLTWNYLEYFLKNSGYIRNGGRFLVPVPIPKIVKAQ